MPNWKMHLRVMLEMCMAPGGNDEALVLVRPHLTEGVSNILVKVSATQLQL